MTLRELMEKSGVNKSIPKELENLEFANGEDLSKKDLSEYFNSNKFQNDIPSIMSTIHTYKEQGIDASFSLFFMEDLDGNIITPLKMKTFENKF